LVIDGQLTLGQLVASELVVTVVVGAFSKAGKSLEKFYDLMAGIDKIGHLIDIPADHRHDMSELPDGPAEVRWGDLVFSGLSSQSKIPSAVIRAGSRVAIVGNDVSGRSLLARTLAGLETASSGLAEIAGYDAAYASANGVGRLVGYAGKNDLFHGTLRENVDLGRSGISQHQVREAIRKVGLSNAVLQLPGGLQARLQTRGYPLTDIQARQLVLARSILLSPKLLIVDGLLDDLAVEDRQIVWELLTAPDAPWTLVVNTNRDDVAKLCQDQIAVRKLS
jgi:putative ABC transport system ATP-binding protein